MAAMAGETQGARLLDRGGLLGADGDDELPQSVGVLVGRAAGEGLVEHDAERPDVGAVVDVLVTAGLLGRHVERRAEHAAGAGERGGLAAGDLGVVGDLGDAEVEQLDHALAGLPSDPTLARKKLAGFMSRWMMPRLVRAVEPEARLRHDAQREIRREGAEPLDELLHVLALEVLHHQEGDVVVRVGLSTFGDGAGRRPGVEHLDDVRRVDGGRGPRLALEAPHQRGVLRRLGGDQLDGDPGARHRVHGLVDRAHAARADQAD